MFERLRDIFSKPTPTWAERCEEVHPPLLWIGEDSVIHGNGALGTREEMERAIKLLEMIPRKYRQKDRFYVARTHSGLFYMSCREPGCDVAFYPSLAALEERVAETGGWTGGLVLDPFAATAWG